MRVSYKKLVDRFLIPRPTLIEWQKRSKDDKDNWRVRHLHYLREQLDVEKMTLEELQKAPIGIHDLFLLSVFVFFNPKVDIVDINSFKTSFREFAFAQKEGVEYQHDFAKKIWSLQAAQSSKRGVADYYRVIDMLDHLCAAQYVLLLRTVQSFCEEISLKIAPTFTVLLDGLTWQELHTYHKSFSDKALRKYFIQAGVLQKEKTLAF